MMGTFARKAACVVFVDLVGIVLVGVPCLLLIFIGEPYNRGFFCGDESIRHPYKESTVPVSALILISYGLPLIIFCLVETSRLKHNGLFSSSRLIVQLYNVARIFLFGAFVNQLFTDTTKYTIGRLRPHFIQVCNPNISREDCGEVDRPNYVTKFICKGQEEIGNYENAKRLHDSRLSFVSGHASLSVFSMGFSIVYLQQQMVGRDFRLLKPLIQVGCVLFALFTSLSRISDYKHHAGDVAGGALLGLTMAAISYRLMIFKSGVRNNTATSTTSLMTVSTSRMYTENSLRNNSPT